MSYSSILMLRLPPSIPTAALRWDSRETLVESLRKGGGAAFKSRLQRNHFQHHIKAAIPTSNQEERWYARPVS